MKLLLLLAILGCYTSNGLVEAASCWTTGIENASYWIQSSGTYGYGNYSSLLANVQHLYYDSDYVYVYITSIPSYEIGPWTNNPNTPSEMNKYFKIPRIACYNTDTVNATSTGTMALGINGVSLYNFWDARYENSVWKRNAYYWEGVSFDSCNGHPDGGGGYHNHADLACLYTKSSSSHSPLLGFSMDGFPIYGPYCYSDSTNSSSAIKICQPCYTYRTFDSNVRSTFINGTSTNYTLSVNTKYPLGSMLDDYECVSGNGDLDEYNGRYGVTPEFPNGIYAYFMTVDSADTSVPAFPFIQAWNYKGVVASKYTYPSAMSTKKLTQVF